MTYNVGNGLALPETLARYVRSSGADIVGLQEVSEEQAEAVAQATSDIYPYLVMRGTGFSGRGLLSRYPITESDWLPLASDRPDLRAVVEISGQPISIFVAHPPPPRLRRRGVVFQPETLAQIDRLAELVVEASPAILVGDFNMTARHPRYAHLAASGLVDSFREAGSGRGATFPLRAGQTQRFNHRLSWVPLPALARIDYVWHTGDLRSLDAWVERGAGSDHLPVFARLTTAQPGSDE
jgi:endonuclease/exonuclease/phosphatase family metal-dependent hydrolase